MFISIEAGGEAFLIDADPDLRETLFARLSKYIIADDAELEDVSRRCMRGEHRRREDLGAGQVRDRDVEGRHDGSGLALGVRGGQEERRPRKSGGD